MSERGSFTTQYILCDTCLEAAKKHLLGSTKGLCSVQIPSWTGNGELLPIIAGKIGGLYADEELHWFEHVVSEALGDDLCPSHTIDVVVMPDSGNSTLYTVRSGHLEAKSFQWREKETSSDAN